ncbi:hypothetical protein R1sor_017386 [Riccia sorocarpa]|uniref:Myb/SANT-like DNA-binding domain-containing protein n=1 Tax=Riccia sorocarpa TaxID=122646 RepID=A0ABD3ICY4_9MARC
MNANAEPVQSESDGCGPREVKKLKRGGPKRNVRHTWSFTEKINLISLIAKDHGLKRKIPFNKRNDSYWEELKRVFYPQQEEITGESLYKKVQSLLKEHGGVDGGVAGFVGMLENFSKPISEIGFTPTVEARQGEEEHVETSKCLPVQLTQGDDFPFPRGLPVPMNGELVQSKSVDNQLFEDAVTMASELSFEAQRANHVKAKVSDLNLKLQRFNLKLQQFNHAIADLSLEFQQLIRIIEPVLQGTRSQYHKLGIMLPGSSQGNGQKSMYRST